MAKITAVIDIGSNSARMIVCQKSSRLAFHIILEEKSRVRISEDCYENSGYLQEKSIKRAVDALKNFKVIADNLKCRKILCVATSAVRDAPNRSYFLQKVRNEAGINIKVIDGKKEAYFGALAAVNLLPYQKEAITVDIGGGSTELALIKDGRILDTISLNIGTIRLKELFYDTKKNFSLLNSFIEDELKNIPKHFKAKKVIGIGGTARAIAKIVMPEDYPLRVLHSYEYSFDEAVEILRKIYTTSVLKLKKYNIKKHRLDTIREGSAIFLHLLDFLKPSSIITSGVGVREGVYLFDILRSAGGIFPENFNPSVKSLQDRFLINEIYANSLSRNSLKIFDALKDIHNIDECYKKELSISAKLSSIGTCIGYYRNSEHTFYLLLNSLNYGFTHSQKLLIAFIALYQNKKLPKEKELKNYLSLLPDLKIVQWLSFILSLCKCLHANRGKNEFNFTYNKGALQVETKKGNQTLFQECVKDLYKPFPLAIVATAKE